LLNIKKMLEKKDIVN